MRAYKLRLSRQGKRKTPENSKPWTEDDDNTMKKLYTEGASISEIATKLVRTEGAIEARLSALKIKRPKERYRRKVEPVWHADNFKVIHELSSQKHGPP
jgi:ribosomal protein S16